MHKQLKAGRIWELDFFRGIALILMIYFHVVYDMKEIFGYKVEYESGVNYFIGKASAILFIFISGLSCTLSRSNIKRGVKLLALAMVITLVTHLMGPSYIINFGILHFLAVCTIISPWLGKLGPLKLLSLAIVLTLMKLVIDRISAVNNYFFIFGVINKNFLSADYYPLIPWSGIYLFGIVVGKYFYSEKKSLLKFTPRDTPINGMGRNTLLLYMLHQPLIVGFLALSKLLFG